MSLSLLKKHNINHMTVRSLSKNEDKRSKQRMSIPKGEVLVLMTNLPFSLFHIQHNTPLKTYQDIYMAEREKKSACWRGRWRIHDVSLYDDAKDACQLILHR